MSKVLFFNVPARGHTYPTLPVVRELVARGERVEYFSVDAFKSLIEKTGATFHSYGNALERLPTEAPPNLLTLPAWIMADCLAVAEVHLETVRASQPDYIIHDSLAAWGKLFACVLGIPAVSSITTFAFRKKSVWADSGFLVECLSMIPTAMPDLWRYWRDSGKIAQRYGLPRFTLFDCFFADEEMNLVYTSRAFQPHAAFFDDRYRFVGSSLDERLEDTYFPWEKLDGRPLVYVSFGTVLNARMDFYRACIEAFSRERVQVAISVGDKITDEEIAALSVHCIAERYVPQLRVLERASVFVTHGGMNSVNEGLCFGVPLVVVPQTAEQVLNANHVAALGAGVVLPRNRMMPGRLREAVLLLLHDERYRQNSRKLGQSLRDAGGYRRAVDEIFAYKRQKGILS